MKTYSINSQELEKVYKERYGVSGIMKIEKSKELAECVGLWLAEGDQKSASELTFTNNNFELIQLFAKNIEAIYNGTNQPRLYVYSNNGKHNIITSFRKVKYYVDKRANKPYYIYRLADRNFLKEWQNLIIDFINDADFYAPILKGFFAGEGNIKETSHHSRSIRIAQKSRKDFLERILNYYKVQFRFSESERAYVISDRYSIEKLAKIGIAGLHKDKRVAFQNLLNNYKQYHYSKLSLKSSLYKLLSVPHTSRELSKKFSRSQARIQRILTQLKKEGKVLSFRVYSNTFWIKKSSNTILISDVKRKYLNFLKNKTLRTFEFALKFEVDSKSAQRRLNELAKLGLIKQNIDKRWELMPAHKKVEVLCQQKS